MELTAGHIHQAESTDGVVVWIWATPWPDLWHVSSSRRQATEEPVRTEQVPALLEAWNFAVEANAWVHWPGPLYKKNPQPEIWALYDAIGRGS